MTIAPFESLSLGSNPGGRARWCTSCGGVSSRNGEDFTTLEFLNILFDN